ncbi:PREDICTED: uncharacterized protein LOC105568822 [Vollenhovia emeryi]|uniref:uncharacterized protein LOC105568822 n=1 Tax=Vollenhovia emeryi TaxID=411798 RepID=UPI0005F485CF|nr:PREDICTED: uncharacterized protein LOC105568822 [Vollenhovia emeryi]
MTKASSISSRRSHFYLPHHGVLKPDSTTTKLRVVFNGSSASTSGYSANDLMYTGAKLHLNISDVLLWIRRHRHIFATDITKMYRQIKIHKDDWELQRILWMDDQLNEVPYHLTTVTYGTKAAPFLAVRTLLQLAEDEGHKYPLAVPSITHGRYVDDIFGGADTIQQLQEVAHQLKGLCMAGGFPLAKWHATHLDILKTVTDREDQGLPITFDDCATKILGLKWLPQEDTFAFSTRSSRKEGRLTKRLVLSEVAQIFDPLGFASPVVIKAKILLQELWLHKLQWDDPLPSQLSTRWLSIREELTSLARLSIPRWLNTWSDSQVELHGFSDASQLAMAAVIYISVNDSNGATFSLVCSKTKVAPLKRLSIPSHASRWKDFVRNRVAQFQELTPAAHWRYIPGTSNPADCASRGLTTTQLQNHALWWTGPPWLLNSDSWPSQPALSDEMSATEARPGVSLLTVTPKAEYQWELIYRFVSRLRKVHDSLPVRHISPETLEKARLFWIRPLKQRTSRTSSRHYRQTHRWQGHTHSTAVVTYHRSRSSTDATWRHTAYAVAHPTTILDSRREGPCQVPHSAVCHVCSVEGDPCSSIDGPTTSLSGYAGTTVHSGVDYAGPLKTWKRRGAKTTKGWICVFVCFSTSAVHLEAVSDYSTEGFIAAYRRFSSRRGIAHTLHSDCGTNFIGADAALKRLFIQSTQEHQRVSHLLSQDNTRWEFNPPATPHMGGKWEAVVKFIKYHLRRTIGESVLTFEELTTLLTQIEAILNSRPLEPLSDDADDIAALTPGHFLVGSPLTAIPEPSLTDLAISRLSRWQLIQQKAHFWTHWAAHYLQRQQAISKWHHRSNEIKVGSLVLITDERLPPCKWPLARITALHPGKDGLVRVVTLKTATTTLIRPVVKLAVLPISS